jgi:RNA polymerase sigma-70 factor (ECF subfamily)
MVPEQDSPGSGKKDKMSGIEELRNSADWQYQLYNRYHQKVFGICLYFLKDREEAKDAAHDVFIKAFRAWKDFEWKCDPLTWIGAIAKHDCFSRRMRLKKQKERRSEIAAEEAMEEGDNGDDLVLHRLRLEKVLPEVRGKLREILRLAMDGLNHREIAVRMGVSRVAITRRLTRFRNELASMGLEREAAMRHAEPSPSHRPGLGSRPRLAGASAARRRPIPAAANTMRLPVREVRPLPAFPDALDPYATAYRPAAAQLIAA